MQPQPPVSVTASRARAAWGVAIPALLLALVCAVRLYRIDAESIWYDESISVAFLGRGSFRAFILGVHHFSPAVPPLYFVIEYLWYWHVSSTEWGLRFLSILMGMGTALVLYLLGRRMHSRLAGALAVTAYALSLVNTYYDQEIRMYALVMLLATLAMGALWCATHGGRSTWWILHGLANGALLWTQPMAGTLLAAQCLYLVLQQPPGMLVRWGLALGIVLLSFRLWLYLIPYGLAIAGLTWIGKPTLLGLLQLAAWPSVLLSTSWSPWWAALALAMLELQLLALALIWRRPKAPGQARGRDIALFLGSWLYLPPLLIYGYSIFFRPAMVDRYVLASSGALMLILGVWIAQMERPVLRYGGAALLVLVLLAGHTTRDVPARRDWHAVCAALPALPGSSNDRVLVWPAYETQTTRFHLDEWRTRQILGLETPQALYGAAKKCASLGAPLYVLAITGGSQSESEELAQLLGAAEVPCTIINHVPGHFVLYRATLPLPGATRPDA